MTRKSVPVINPGNLVIYLPFHLFEEAVGDFPKWMYEHKWLPYHMTHGHWMACMVYGCILSIYLKYLSKNLYKTTHNPIGKPNNTGIIRSGKSGKCTDAAGVRPGIRYAGRYSFCTKKWRCFHMGNPNLLPYETIVRATKK